VECLVAHADGTRERLWLRHSYTDTQLDWFRAGSALNAAAHSGR
jgi:aconitate hydratase